MSYQYDAASRRTRMTWPDAVFVTYAYNTASQLTAIRETGAQPPWSDGTQTIYDQI